ncbi:hypothetical protein GCM10020369_04010 [Cryptosporangium minutisporangium]|uniref:Uncharacterized protein n=1 Tax=Cryptosporangium minutisporangium TaxID=113569 RepID=A0ABP6SQI9_9ACTN
MGRPSPDGAAGAVGTVTAAAADPSENAPSPLRTPVLPRAARAARDLRTLGGHVGSGRPIVRLHLTDRAAGLAQLLEAVR